jgi:hypothetical protein
MGGAINEIFTQVMARIYNEISGCKLALFSKPKFITTRNYFKFRQFFNAEYKAGFVVRSDSFDNVSGKFPIIFTIWDLNGKIFPHCVTMDVPEDGGTKTYWDGFEKSINNWIRQFDYSLANGIGYLICESPDFQHIHQPYITLEKDKRLSRQFVCNNASLINACVYFATRLVVEPTWLNDRDQFYYPTSDGWKTNTTFQNDCLVYTLFHGQNRISCKDGVNHWIPFTEEEVDARSILDSSFMSDFLKARAKIASFSPEAQAVLNAGLALYRYYHKTVFNNKTADVNASFYDIRAFFQGKDHNGRMNNTSKDPTYNTLLTALRDAYKPLTAKIVPKVYEYGFLKK